MKIIKSAVGNNNEAFIEENYKDGFNIISSDDNNKGKTILIQSMMYALGNEPTFPVSFQYKDYYHYVEFEENGKFFKLCRFQDSFIIKNKDFIIFLENTSELKRYWKKHIYELPTIFKNKMCKIVDPVLFLQLFFVGQDKKDTSNILHSGYYKKDDYYNMIYSILKIDDVDNDDLDFEYLRSELKNLKEEKKLLLKENSILKSENPSISYLSSVNDKINFEEKIKNLDKIREKIENLRKKRNRLAIRKTKWEITLKELNSLNRNINCGELRCMDCNSTHITYCSNLKNSYTFDISTSDMRKEIINSIKEKMSMIDEEIENLSIQIGNCQDNLNDIMSDQDVTLEAILNIRAEYQESEYVENKIHNIENDIEDISNKIGEYKQDKNYKKEKREEILEQILLEMNESYKSIDAFGTLHFENLFTKKDEVYSGSESTIFHLVKLLAIQKVIGHNFPIIVDSFRAEDLSTQKESIVIDLFNNIKNQKIFTTTLKEEEIGKYDRNKKINHIDYQNHMSSKMLNKDDVSQFLNLLNEMKVKI